MKSAGRVLELSLAANSPSASFESSSERTRDLKAATTPLERPLALGLDYLARRHGRLAKSALGGISKLTANMSYLGNGAMASVYRDGEEVIKVYRQTAVMTPDERAAYLEEHSVMGEALQTHLGVMVANQTFQISMHPLGAYEVVIGKQPFVPGEGLDLFATNTTNLNRAAISDYCERTDTAKDHLQELVEATFAGSDTAGLVPDLNGTDNFRLHGKDEALVLIDAEPVSRLHHPEVHDLILSQADSLGAFMNVA